MGIQIVYAAIVVTAAIVLVHVDRLLGERSDQLSRNIVPTIDTYSAIEHIQLPYERLYELVEHGSVGGEDLTDENLDTGIQTVQAEFFTLLNPKSRLALVIEGSQVLQDVQQTAEHFDLLAVNLRGFARGTIPRDRVVMDLVHFREELNWLSGKFYDEQIRNYDSLVSSIAQTRHTFQLVVAWWLFIAAIFAILIWLAHLMSQQLIKEREHALERKRLFISMFSHDIRNPLQMVAASVEKLVDLTDGFVDGIIGQEDVVNIQDTARKLDGQFAKIETRMRVFGDFARLESRHLKPAAEIVDLNRLLEEIVASYSEDVQQRGLLLTTSIDPNLSTISTDRLKLEQIIRNLVDNAVKYTTSGEIRVHLLWHVRRNLRITVCDTGCGINKDDLKKIFEPFVRMHEAVKPAHGPSIGLGLSIVDLLVDILGGSVTVRSKLNLGTTFVVEIPVSRVSALHDS